MFPLKVLSRRRRKCGEEGFRKVTISEVVVLSAGGSGVLIVEFADGYGDGGGDKFVKDESIWRQENRSSHLLKRSDLRPMTVRVSDTERDQVGVLLAVGFASPSKNVKSITCSPMRQPRPCFTKITPWSKMPLCFSERLSSLSCDAFVAFRQR